MIGQSDRNSVLLWTGQTSGDVVSVCGTGTSSTTYCSFNHFVDFGITRNASGTGNSASLRLTCAIVCVLLRVGAYDSVYGVYSDSGADAFYQDSYAGGLNHSSSYAWYFTTQFANGGVTFTSSRVIDCVAESSTYGMYANGIGGVADLYLEGFETAACATGFYATSGVHVVGQWQNDNVHLVRCIFDANSISGIVLSGIYNSGAYVDINSCYIAQSPAASGPAIDIENCSGVNVRGCDIRVSGTGTKGILVNGANSYGVIISDNQIINAVTASAATYGIEFNGSNGGAISGNVVFGPNGYPFTTGIQLVSATRAAVIGNSLLGYMTTGLSYDSSSNNNTSTGNSVDTTNIGTAKSDSGTGNGAGI